MTSFLILVNLFSQDSRQTAGNGVGDGGYPVPLVCSVPGKLKKEAFPSGMGMTCSFVEPISIGPELYASKKLQVVGRERALAAPPSPPPWA